MKLLKLNLQPRLNAWTRTVEHALKEYEVRIPIKQFKNSWIDFARNSRWYSIKNGDLVIAFKSNTDPVSHYKILPFTPFIDGLIPMNALRWKNALRWYDKIKTRELANLDGSPVKEGSEEIPF